MQAQACHWSAVSVESLTAPAMWVDAQRDWLHGSGAKTGNNCTDIGNKFIHLVHVIDWAQVPSLILHASHWTQYEPAQVLLPPVTVLQE